MRSLAILLVLPLMLAGCDIFESDVCLTGNCFSGVEIHFQDPPDDEFVLTLTSNEGEAKTVNCSPCALEFEGFLPDEVTVRYESATRVVERTFTPTYERSRPNGPDCPPLCLLAAIDFDLSVEA